jgi:uncharacterized protein
MSRPCTFRRIYETPRIVCYKPAGIPMSALEEVRLGLDELEAVRMADLEGLYHEAAAERMGVSRQTFGNIVESARKKIADALVNGKALVIEGGRVTVAAREFVCLACANDWLIPFGEQRPEKCPCCGSENIHRNWSPAPDSKDSAPRGCGGRRKRCGRHGNE